MAGHSAIPGYTKAVKQFKELCLQQDEVYCYFCGEQIRMQLHHTNRMAFTTQHITPISRGGSPIAIENMAPAHRSCNAKEGNRLAGTHGGDGDMTIGPQLRRSRIW